MTQSEIADDLGLSTEHVNRVLRRLRESGILTVQDRVVTIDRMSRLLQVAAPLQDIDEHKAPVMSGSSAGTGPSGYFQE